MGAWSPRQRSAVLWGGILVFLTIEVLERTFFLLFELNFSIDGPGPWTLGVLALVSGVLYVVGLQRDWPHGPLFLGLCTAASPLLLAVSFAPQAEAALFGALGWHLVATPLLFAMVSSLRRRATLALALGLAIRLACRAWAVGAPLVATSTGTYLLMAFSIVGAGLWFQVVRDVAGGARRLPNPAPVWAFFFAAVAWFGTPSAVWSWTGAAPVATTAAALAGTAAGAWSALRGSWAGPARAWQGAGALFVAAVWTLWGPWPPGGLALACWGAIVALDSALDRPRHARMRRHAAATMAVQSVAVLIVFLHIVAVNWAFVDGAALLRGHADTFLLVLMGLLAVSVLRRQDWGAPS